MSVYPITDMKLIETLFDQWQETMIWSCLQGVMGSAWADSSFQPQSAKLVIADFCFFAGKPNSELILHKPDGCDFIIMIGQTTEWETLIEQTCRGSCKKVIRYALKKEPDVFDRNALSQIAASIIKPYQLRLFDEDIFRQAKGNIWSRDLCSQYLDYKEYKRLGIGVAVTDRAGQLVAGASSYTVYHGGIEIQIDTREDCRRKGLAAACGARLLLECQDRNLYPSWDAQNQGSLALAQRLGYHFDKEYHAFEVNDSGS